MMGPDPATCRRRLRACACMASKACASSTPRSFPPSPPATPMHRPPWWPTRALKCCSKMTNLDLRLSPCSPLAVAAASSDAGHRRRRRRRRPGTQPARRSIRPELAQLGHLAVGVRTVTLIDRDAVDVVAPHRDRALRVDLWYPATLPHGAQARGLSGYSPGRTARGAGGVHDAGYRSARRQADRGTLSADRRLARAQQRDRGA